MKKALSLLLALVLCLSLCACGGNELSSKEKALAGEWLDNNGVTMVLADSGRGMTLSNDNGAAFYWEVFDGKLYIYKDFTAGSYTSHRYTISGDSLLNADGEVVYTKK